MNARVTEIAPRGVTEIAPVSSARTDVVSSGARGAPGPAGGGALSRTAAQSLGGHRVVRALANNEVDYATASNPAHADAIVGLTIGAAALGGPVEIRTAGEVTEPSWSWTLGPVFCGLNGVLTQTPPASGFIRQIGIADAPDRIIVDLRPPILL